MSTRITVYVETSVIGYATSRPSRDPLVAARQELTRQWFDACTSRCDLYLSQLVIDEIVAGDVVAARERLEFASRFPLVEAPEEALDLASSLIKRRAVPAKAAEDALHISVAAVNGLQFLATWNCKHIANAFMRVAIERVCRDAGFEPPIICTPEELDYEPQE